MRFLLSSYAETYLLMQELFVDKIHFFKLFSMRDKPRMHQLKIITSTGSAVKAFLAIKTFHLYGEIPSKKGKYPVLRRNTKSPQLIKHTKISHSLSSLVFSKFSCGTY